MVYQAILSGAYISLIGVSTPYLDYSTSAVFSLLSLFSLLGGLLSLLIPSSDFLVFGSHNLGSFSSLQKSSLFL